MESAGLNPVASGWAARVHDLQILQLQLKFCEFCEFCCDFAVSYCLSNQTQLLTDQVSIVAPPAPLLQKLLPYPALRTLAAHLMRLKRPPVKPQTALVKVFCMPPT
jgi:hypothetical protein